MALAVFFLATMPIGDGDYYWHIAHGRAIVERGALLTEDLFIHAADKLPSDPAIESSLRSMLRQYWLAQVLLYLLQEACGEAGVVALRALIYTTLVALVYLQAGARANRATGLLFGLLLADVLLEYPGERPALFSYAWCFAAVLLLERITAARGERRGLSGVALAAVMWLWANTHGSFTLGVLLVGAYAGGHLWSTLVRREGRLEPALLLWLAGAMAVTLLNPGGTSAITFGVKLFGDATKTDIHEFLPPLSAARDFGEYFPGYWLFLAITAVALVAHRARLRPQHLIALAGLAVLSLSGIRYMVYLLLAAPLVASYPLLRGRWSELRPAHVLVAACWFFTQDYRQGLSFGPSPLFPVRGADALRVVEDPWRGELFNFYDWGGYLSWRDPRRKVFIDGRSYLNFHPDLDEAYQSILWTPGWESGLRRFDVSVVLIPGMSSFSGKVFPLVRALHRSPDWRLTFANGEALLFQRGSLPKSPEDMREEARMIREHLMLRSRAVAAYFGDNAGVRLTGEIAGKELSGLPPSPPPGLEAEVQAHRL